MTDDQLHLVVYSIAKYGDLDALSPADRALVASALPDLHRALQMKRDAERLIDCAVNDIRASLP